jgi:four helix bundle protein
MDCDGKAVSGQHSAVSRNGFMKDFRDLQVWDKAHRMVLDVYRETASFPSDERFGITQQIRRSSASVPTNIAEGCGRSGDAEFCRFLRIAMGSASETEYLLLLSHDLRMLSDPLHSQLTNQVQEVKRMLSALITKLSGP